MSLYLDTSILIPLLVPEPRSKSLQAWIETATDTLLISDLAVAEFHSAMSRYVRMKHLPEDAVAISRAGFESWCRGSARRVENLPVDTRRAAELVQVPSPKLLTPDAIHIATCERLGATLVTHDDAMVYRASRRGLTCVVP